MSMISASDLSGMITSLGGESVEIEGVDVPGIFQDRYEAQLAYNMEIDSSSPVFLCRSSDIPLVKDGDSLYRGEEIYYIKSVQPDGTGLTFLILSKDF